ncbi:AAA family ATPase [Nocardia camponoti]|uniref:AAA family ATPase n=1 Tax=Nocardia camponoti TaxID=1616106 RepID=A0A917QDL3_9NOCA|nr:AAA family ATPase [Nocardia camponoti]GGK44803.1 hypothetical protein GCM10011591_15510 [Nocardia camponoti]
MTRTVESAADVKAIHRKHLGSRVENVPRLEGRNVLHPENGSSESLRAEERGNIVPEDLERSENVPGTFQLPTYFNVAAMLGGTLPDPPTPDVCARTDGVGLFYRNQYNAVFGDPESGKTLLTDYATVTELAAGGRVLRVDLDHNGPDSTIRRLLAMGAPVDVLSDPNRFLYIEPEDRREMGLIADHMATWGPTLVVLDSIGELLPLYGSSSNSADEFTDTHRIVIKPLVRTGACVIGIDHLAKGGESRGFGPGGTIAKTRAIGGSSIRVTVDVAFTPGKGGSAHLTINKDRHGGLRQHSPTADKEPLAGKFVIWPSDDGSMRPEVKAPDDGERNPGEAVPQADIVAIAALDPPPKTIKDARECLRWNNKRASAAFKAWKAASQTIGQKPDAAAAGPTLVDSRTVGATAFGPVSESGVRPELDAPQESTDEVGETALDVMHCLHADGISDAKIADSLNSGGYRTKTGKEYSGSLVWKHRTRDEKRRVMVGQGPAR